MQMEECAAWKGKGRQTADNTHSPRKCWVSPRGAESHSNMPVSQQGKIEPEYSQDVHLVMGLLITLQTTEPNDLTCLPFPASSEGPAVKRIGRDGHESPRGKDPGSLGLLQSYSFPISLRRTLSPIIDLRQPVFRKPTAINCCLMLQKQIQG